jgi:hypothetical protein
MDWKKRLEERKQTYRAMRKGTEDQRQIAYMDGSFGVDIRQEQEFQDELHGIVDDMTVKLIDETKILEGTLKPEYGKGDWEIPVIVPENELSHSILPEEQWRSDSQNGCSTTDRIRASTHDSNILSCTAEHSNPASPTMFLRRQSTLSQISFCSGNSAASGTETDVMNEFSECTVPMTNEQTHGTPSEAR